MKLLAFKNGKTACFWSFILLLATASARRVRSRKELINISEQEQQDDEKIFWARMMREVVVLSAETNTPSTSPSLPGSEPGKTPVPTQLPSPIPSVSASTSSQFPSSSPSFIDEGLVCIGNPALKCIRSDTNETGVSFCFLPNPLVSIQLCIPDQFIQDALELEIDGLFCGTCPDSGALCEPEYECDNGRGYNLCLDTEELQGSYCVPAFFAPVLIVRQLASCGLCLPELSAVPSIIPSVPPSTKPSFVPSTGPTTNVPSLTPSSRPSAVPTEIPSRTQSSSPVTPTPTLAPGITLLPTVSVVPPTLPSQSVAPTTPGPSAVPSEDFSMSPSFQPSGIPSNVPSIQPSPLPTVSEAPSNVPSTMPTSSSMPSARPSFHPSNLPSDTPSSIPSDMPSAFPSLDPTDLPSEVPSSSPVTSSPTLPPGVTLQPTTSFLPSIEPSMSPSTQNPSTVPTQEVSNSPSVKLTERPSTRPSSWPPAQTTLPPSSAPSIADPVCSPSISCNTSDGEIGELVCFDLVALPSKGPFDSVTICLPRDEIQDAIDSGATCGPCSPGFPPETDQPSSAPSERQPICPLDTSSPCGDNGSSICIKYIYQGNSLDANLCIPYSLTGIFESEVSKRPGLFEIDCGECPSPPPFTFSPTQFPSSSPSTSAIPTDSDYPTMQGPTSPPSQHPSDSPSLLPTKIPSRSPSETPSTVPSPFPSNHPSSKPSTDPSFMPSTLPSLKPSLVPSGLPSSFPSWRPSENPSPIPSTRPSNSPTQVPSDYPTDSSSLSPSQKPLTPGAPTLSPTRSTKPSTQPSEHPTDRPSKFPTILPSEKPSGSTTSAPTFLPSNYPSAFPSFPPSSVPSALPSPFPSSSPTIDPLANCTDFLPCSATSYEGAVMCIALVQSDDSLREECIPFDYVQAVLDSNPSNICGPCPTLEPTVAPSPFPPPACIDFPCTESGDEQKVFVCTYEHETLCVDTATAELLLFDPRNRCGICDTLEGCISNEFLCGNNKIQICHHQSNSFQTLCISTSALSSHEANHCDYCGECEGTPPPWPECLSFYND